MAGATQIEDMVVVIAGSATGDGLAYTNAFLAAGAQVVAMDISWPGVQMPRMGSSNNPLTISADVTKDIDLDKAYLATVDHFGTVDVLINNLDLAQVDSHPANRARTLEIDDSVWNRSFAVNLLGALKVTRRFIRPMSNKKSGSVVNMVPRGVLHRSSGSAGLAASSGDGDVAFHCAKAALMSAGFALAEEVRERNVAVNMVVPDGAPVDRVASLLMHLASRDGRSMTGRLIDAAEWSGAI